MAKPEAWRRALWQHFDGEEGPEDEVTALRRENEALRKKLKEAEKPFVSIEDANRAHAMALQWYDATGKWPEGYGVGAESVDEDVEEEEEEDDDAEEGLDWWANGEEDDFEANTEI